MQQDQQEKKCRECGGKAKVHINGIGFLCPGHHQLYTQSLEPADPNKDQIIVTVGDQSFDWLSMSPTAKRRMKKKFPKIVGAIERALITGEGLMDKPAEKKEVADGDQSRQES